MTRIIAITTNRDVQAALAVAFRNIYGLRLQFFPGPREVAIHLFSCVIPPPDPSTWDDIILAEIQDPRNDALLDLLSKARRLAIPVFLFGKLNAYGVKYLVDRGATDCFLFPMDYAAIAQSIEKFHRDLPTWKTHRIRLNEDESTNEQDKPNRPKLLLA